MSRLKLICPFFANRLSVQQESEQVWTRNRPTDTHTNGSR